MFQVDMTDIPCTRIREMRRQAEEQRRAHRIVAAHRWQRRADAASRRARLIRDTIA